MKNPQSSFLLVVCGVAVLTGCASSSVEKSKVDLAGGPITKNHPIYVKDFDASKAIFNGEYSDVSEKVAAQRVRVPQIISLETINRLTENGYTAQRYPSVVPTNAVILEGEVTLVDAGSGAARFWVGFGAGTSTVRANVRIYRASEPDKSIADLVIIGSSGGRGGISGGYKDWIGANSREVGIKLGDYLMGKK